MVEEEAVEVDIGMRQNPGELTGSYEESRWKTLDVRICVISLVCGIKKIL